MRIWALGTLASVLLAVSVTGASAAPANDDRSYALTIAGFPSSDIRDTSGATLEASEPQPSCGPVGATVWYRTQPTTRSRLLFKTFGSKYDTVISVFTESPSGLQQVACNDDAEHLGSLQSETSFIAEKDVALFIQVGGFEGASGSMKLSASIDPRPANDDLAEAETVISFPFSSVAKLSGATMETEEPIECSGPLKASVWFKLSTSSALTIVAKTPDTSSIIDVYRGSGLGDLSFVACNQYAYTDDLRLTMVPGSVYYLRVASAYYNDPTDRALTIETLVPPVNDDFSHAVSIAGVPFRHEVDNAGASLETSEPSPSCAYFNVATVWYKIATVERQPLLISTADSEADTFVAVYEGSQIDDLLPVACGTNAGIGRSQAMVGFFSEPGRTFFIQVGSESAAGRIVTEVRYGASAEVADVVQLGGGWDGNTLEAAGGAAYIVGGGGAVVADTSTGETDEDACLRLFVIGYCL